MHLVHFTELIIIVALSHKTDLFLWNYLNDIVHSTTKSRTDFNKNVAGDNGTVFAHFGNGGDADAGFFGEFFFLHVAVDQELK